MVCGKPDEIIPDPSLDAGLPSPAKESVQFPGEKVRQGISPDCEWNRIE